MDESSSPSARAFPSSSSPAKIDQAMSGRLVNGYIADACLGGNVTGNVFIVPQKEGGCQVFFAEFWKVKPSAGRRSRATETSQPTLQAGMAR